MRLLLSGYYGFDNAGDEALLEGLLSGLRGNGVDPVVLSARPQETRRQHGVISRHRMWGAPAGLLACDGLLSGGGGLLQDSTSGRSLRYYLALIEGAKRLGKCVVVYGQSIGPLSPRGERMVARALRDVPVFVRDGPSREALSRLAVPSTLVADPALLLEPPDRSSALRRDESESVLLIPRAGKPQLSEALGRLGGRLLDEGRNVRILALQPRADAVETERVGALAPGATLLRPTNHREALASVAASHLVVSARLHGLVFAFLARVPAVGLVYDPKVSAFLAESGGVGFSPPVEPSALYAAALAARPPDDETWNALVNRARTGMELLATVLRPGGSAVAA